MRWIKVGTGSVVSLVFARDSRWRSYLNGWSQTPVLAFRGPTFPSLFWRRPFQEIQSRWGRGFDAEIASTTIFISSWSFLLMALVISLSHILSNSSTTIVRTHDRVEARVEKFFTPWWSWDWCWFYFFLFKRPGFICKGTIEHQQWHLRVFKYSYDQFDHFGLVGNWPMGLSWGVAVGGLMVILYAPKIWNIDIWKTPWNLPFKRSFFVWPDGAQIRWFLQLPFILLPLSLLQCNRPCLDLGVARLPQQGLPSYFYLCDRLLNYHFFIRRQSCFMMTQPLITAK